jgi:hypothetical protein
MQEGSAVPGVDGHVDAINLISLLRVSVVGEADPARESSP